MAVSIHVYIFFLLGKIFIFKETLFLVTALPFLCNVEIC